jgi:protein gp37
MSLTKTGIDYLTHSWNFYTGCKHDKTVCPVADKCWARGMSKRFGRSFEPTLHPEKLLAPLSLKKPARIGVCFTGDLFGDWVDPCQIIESQDPRMDGVFLAAIIKQVVADMGQHQFFFLTKNPKGYQKWGKFPDNAWVGATVCNQKMLETAFTTMTQITTGHGWLSIEPLMERLDCAEFIDVVKEYQWIEWVVIGGWSGSKTAPDVEWVKEIVRACDRALIPVFLKDNLKPLYGEDLRQALPNKEVTD